MIPSLFPRSSVICLGLEGPRRSFSLARQSGCKWSQMKLGSEFRQRLVRKELVRRSGYFSVIESFVLVKEYSLRKVSHSVHSRNTKHLKNEFTSVSFAISEFNSSTGRGDFTPACYC